MNIKDFEQVTFCNDPQTGLSAIIAIHSTTLGPAVGGCRYWAYTSDSEALEDALRLARGMTYKAAISNLKWGGGKSVIIGTPEQKTPALLQKFGEFVQRFQGLYVTAKDVGIDAAALREIKKGTSHILGIAGDTHSSGDPSPATAWGVYHGMKATAKHALGTDQLKGVTVALQGLGSVSLYLLKHLVEAGAKTIGCDIDPRRCDEARLIDPNIRIVSTDAIYDVSCDIFSPNALGSTINPETLKKIKSKAIAGAANNQLSEDSMGAELVRAGIAYAPDYALNAGGLINIYHEAMVSGGYLKDRAFDQVAGIYMTIDSILQRSKAENKPTSWIADRIAEERIEKKRKINS